MQLLLEDENALDRPRPQPVLERGDAGRNQPRGWGRGERVEMRGGHPRQHRGVPDCSQTRVVRIIARGPQICRELVIPRVLEALAPSLEVDGLGVSLGGCRAQLRLVIDARKIRKSSDLPREDARFGTSAHNAAREVDTQLRHRRIGVGHHARPRLRSSRRGMLHKRRGDALGGHRAELPPLQESIVDWLRKPEQPGGCSGKDARHRVLAQRLSWRNPFDLQGCAVGLAQRFRAVVH